MAERAGQRLAMHVAMAQTLAGEETAAAIAAAARDLAARFATGGTLLIFGNGGSAADAQHLAAEFTGRYLLDRAPLPALALADNTASVTAIANDYGFDQVFARQVRAFGSEGGAAIALSTSGAPRTCWRGCGPRASWGCSRSE
jgi:D-sedoheptulose 7-phosphate isomerase